ncbi:hypothetical protein [Pseudomonas sp. MF6754]|nr:hypothetical protein [Pseudomonas sp. MF6754]MBK3453240.1 hypothetical protein [Pseudomonas sp. MF6754]
MRDLVDEKIEVGEPLMQQTLQAVSRYNEAQGVKPADAGLKMPLTSFM